jgi:hypothetical protein
MVKLELEGGVMHSESAETNGRIIGVVCLISSYSIGLDKTPSLLKIVAVRLREMLDACQWPFASII